MRLTVFWVSLFVAALSMAGGTPASAQIEAKSDAERLKALQAQVRARAARSPRIVNGETARDGDLPWQAALMLRDDGSGAKPIERLNCGGAFIRPNIVMTAAHCVGTSDFIGNLKDWVVVSGAARIDDPRMVTYDITDVVVHPRYAELGLALDYDFALLRVAQRFNGPTIEVISAAESDRIAVGTVAQVSGWGATSEGGASSRDLQKLDIKVVSRGDCNDANSYNGIITTRMLCAGVREGGKDSCQGDSGGPLTAAVGPNGQRRLIGVVSWGLGCAQPNKYGVYGRLVAVRGWISEMVAMLERPN